MEEKLREESGNVSYPASDWLTSFLYELMRDAACGGSIEKIVRNLEKEKDSDNDTLLYTNGWLAKYAKHLADRLRNIDK